MRDYVFFLSKQLSVQSLQNNVSKLFNLVIISCSTCYLVGPVKATWVSASFNSNLVIISCRSDEAASTAAEDDLIKAVQVKTV